MNNKDDQETKQKLQKGIVLDKDGKPSVTPTLTDPPILRFPSCDLVSST
jgi:hypothetical protein